MIDIRNLLKLFSSGKDIVRAVDNVDLDIGEKEFFVLLGLSGSGKTTLMRCVAGLEKPDGGAIGLDNTTVSDAERGLFIAPERRGIGMVFQSYAIWPHMSVFDNVAFPLANGPRRFSRDEIKKKATRALESVQLAGLADRPAPFLSGGQQQRVARARALAVEPKVLLMDEPLSNLDARLREEVRDEIKNVAKNFGTAVLYVTHDQVEAMALADRIAIMSKGKVLQCAAPRQLYDHPTSREACEFLGLTNLLDGVRAGDRITTSLGVLACDANTVAATEVTAAIRPEELQVMAQPSGQENEFAAEITTTSFLGELTVCDLMVNGTRLRLKTTQSIAPVKQAFVRLPKERLKLFPR
jgi:ABC-type Fe3+/spermidine/putrescine transport system ATPase subunit